MNLKPCEFYIRNHEGAIIYINAKNPNEPLIEVLKHEWVDDVPELAKISDVDSLLYFLKSRIPSKNHPLLHNILSNTNEYDEWYLLEKYQGKTHKDPIWIKFID